MKKIFAAFVLSAAIALAVGFVSTGCKSTSVQTTAYTTLATLESAVNAAEQGYMDLIVKGAIPTNSLASEAKAYNQFQTDFGMAVTLVSGALTNAAPPALTTEGNAFITSVANLQTGK